MIWLTDWAWVSANKYVLVYLANITIAIIIFRIFIHASTICMANKSAGYSLNTIQMAATRFFILPLSNASIWNEFGQEIGSFVVVCPNIVCFNFVWESIHWTVMRFKLAMNAERGKRERWVCNTKAFKVYKLSIHPYTPLPVCKSCVLSLFYFFVWSVKVIAVLMMRVAVFERINTQLHRFRHRFLLDCLKTWDKRGNRCSPFFDSFPFLSQGDWSRSEMGKVFMFTWPSLMATLHANHT